MRRLILVVAAALAALVTVGSAAAADGLRLTELGSARFPERGYALSLPSERTLVPESVRVTENGRAVSGLTVVPATALGSDEYALVLVIDASESMRGRPIVAAMAAARAFAAQRNPAQKLAVVVFNAKTTVLLPFTTDPAYIDAALATTPRVAYYTRTHDTLIEIVHMLRQEQIAAASIVLLSDGQELDSRATADEAVAAAKQAGVRIFSVGLRSRSFDQSALRALAEETGGFYTEATAPKQLSRIFSGLGSQLANEYFIHYRSLAGADEDVEVAVRVDGFQGRATTGYRTPALPPALTIPYVQPGFERFVLSGWTMVLVALLTSALVAASVALLLLPRRSTLRSRIGAFVSLAQPAQREQRRERRENRVRLATPEERQEGPSSRWTRFEEELQIARIGVSASSIVLWTVIGTLALGWLLASGVPLATPLALTVPVLVRTYIKMRLARVRRRFGDQLPDNLEVLVSGLRAGHSLVGALSLVVADAPEPSQSELNRVVTDEQLGIPLEQGLSVVVRRMDSRDLDQVALVARLQRETGANSVEVLERVVENIRDRQAVRRLVRTLTAQGRLSGGVLVGLPIFMLMFMVVANGAYVAPLFSEPLGQAMLIVALLMVGLGWWAIRRIVNIKV